MPSRIEWTEETWNPITGCTPCSPGCDHCYARRMAQRLRGRCGYPTDNPFAVTVHEDKFDQPARWRKPRRIFVCSMGDLFHEAVQPHHQDWVARSMGDAPQHTYLMLTKRAKRMRDFLACKEVHQRQDFDMPLLRIWAGVTVCNQEEADAKIPYLAMTRAEVRYLSCEPLLGPIDLTRYIDRIDWVIVGGETGPGARPPETWWVRQIRYDCERYGVPFFFKRWGNDGNRYLDGKLYEQYPNP